MASGWRWWVSAAVCGAMGVVWLPPYHQALVTAHPPERILVLGGDVDRERAGMQLARQLKLPLVVSGGSNPEYAHWLMEAERLPQSQVAFDYRANDTLGNFTSLVDDFRQEGVQHLYLVTSEDHLPRALMVGTLVAGSRGIKLTALPVSCGGRCVEESAAKRWADGFRALVWVVTGRDLQPWARTQ
ncbi:MAG: YdcF family protein [Synechococcus sp.]